MNEVAIRVEGLGKRYRLGQRESYKALRDVIAQGVSSPFRRALDGRGASRRDAARGYLWALQDLTIDIPRGEPTGVIGANGAGKSTFLKVLSHVTEPTTGCVEVHGRIGSLLEVGTGFHPELTGRENIYLNGAILGMKRAEITRKLDEIVAFAEVEKFLDTPVKRYSSGMYVRLAFAVAAHLEPDVLIVDEVLAVGDAQFQRKCLGKMKDVSSGDGRTILFVSHNMDAIARLCSQALLLDRGRLATYGPTSSTITHYLSSVSSRAAPRERVDVSGASRIGTGEARFLSVQYSSCSAAAAFQPYSDGPLEFVLEVWSDAPRSIGSLAVTLWRQTGTKLVNADTVLLGQVLDLDKGSNTVQVRINHLHLNPDVYTLSLWLADPISARSGSPYDYIETAMDIEVVSLSPTPAGLNPGAAVTCDFEVVRLD